MQRAVYCRQFRLYYMENPLSNVYIIDIVFVNTAVLHCSYTAVLTSVSITSARCVPVTGVCCELSVDLRLRRYI